jgi:hypothetical protein
MLTMRMILSLVLLTGTSGTTMAYGDRDQAYAFNLPSHVNDFSSDFSRRVDLNRRFYQQPAFVTPWSSLAPELNLNYASMRMTEIPVRDLADTVWKYEQTNFHFNPDTKQVDSYQAKIQVKRDGVELAQPLLFEMGKMAFEAGKGAPTAYRRTVQDHEGNSVRVDRFHQTSAPNPEYTRFVQYYEQNQRRTDVIHKNHPIEPTRELVQRFDEKWTVSENKQARPSTFLIHVDDIQHDSCSVTLKLDSWEHKGGQRPFRDKRTFRARSSEPKRGSRYLRVNRWPLERIK